MTVVTFALPKAFLQSLKMPGTKIYLVIIQRIKRDASQTLSLEGFVIFTSSLKVEYSWTTFRNHAYPQ
jgi:hypothetical protein